MKKLVQIFSQDFQWILSIFDATLKRTILPVFSAGFPVVSLSILLVLILSSCHSMKQVEVVERVKTDTVYQSNVQYDSIYIFSDHYIDRSKDTVYINDRTTEFRYKLLRDTIYKSKIDSIPVIKTVELEKQVKYVPWYTKTLVWIGAIAILLVIITIVIKLTKHQSV